VSLASGVAAGQDAAAGGGLDDLLRVRDLELGQQVALGLGQLGGLPQCACRAGEGAEGGESMAIVRPSSVVPLALTRVNGANAVARAQAVVSGIAARCLAEPEVLVSIGTAVAGGGIFAVSPSSGPLGTRLTENIPAQKIQAPVLLAQGEADPPGHPRRTGRLRQDRMRHGHHARLPHLPRTRPPLARRRDLAPHLRAHLLDPGPVRRQARSLDLLNLITDSTYLT
jgi:hypothetical protein